MQPFLTSRLNSLAYQLHLLVNALHSVAQHGTSAAAQHGTAARPVVTSVLLHVPCQVGLYCPKVAIMMEGWATDSKPAQFEVAAQELSAKYHSGVQSVGHGQTGQGSMSLQVLLPALS